MTQSSAVAGARTESLGKLKEEQLKVGPKGAQHRGRCKSSSDRRSARRAREWERASQIYSDGRQGYAQGACAGASESGSSDKQACRRACF